MGTEIHIMGKTAMENRVVCPLGVKIKGKVGKRVSAWK